MQWGAIRNALRIALRLVRSSRFFPHNNSYAVVGFIIVAFLYLVAGMRFALRLFLIFY